MNHQTLSVLFPGTALTGIIAPRAAAESTVRYWRKHLARHRQAHAVFCRGKLAESSIADLIGIRLATRRLYTIEHRADFPDPGAVASLRNHGRAMRWLVHRTIAVSEEITRSAITHLGLPPRRVATCLNWFDPIFQPVTPDQRRQAKHQLGLSPDDLVVGYHGRLAPEKSLPALIDAFAQQRPPAKVTLKLVLVGDGWKRRELEERIRARDRFDRVHDGARGCARTRLPQLRGVRGSGLSKDADGPVRPQPGRAVLRQRTRAVRRHLRHQPASAIARRRLQGAWSFA